MVCYHRDHRNRPKEVFMPLYFEPGEEAQVDWYTQIRVFCLTRVMNYGNNDVDLDNGQVGGQGH